MLRIAFSEPEYNLSDKSYKIRKEAPRKAVGDGQLSRNSPLIQPPGCILIEIPGYLQTFISLKGTNLPPGDGNRHINSQSAFGHSPIPGCPGQPSTAT